jgi:hypothetical protein
MHIIVGTPYKLTDGMDGPFGDQWRHSAADDGSLPRRHSSR